MPDLSPYYIQKIEKTEEGKQLAKERQAARKRVELYWSRAIEHVIERNQAATPTTIAATLGVNPQPQTPQERTALRSLYRRCDRGAAHGRFRAFYEYTTQAHGEDVPKDRRRQHAGKVWYVSNFVTRIGGFQYKHKALIAHVRETFEKLDTFDLLKTDTELRDAKPLLIYDLYGKLGEERLAIDCNRTDWPKEMSKKCRDWQRMVGNDRYEFPFPADRYLWVMETEERAWNLRDRWAEDGLTAGNFLVSWVGAFSPYTPSSILGDVWLWAKDETKQSLRRE